MAILGFRDPKAEAIFAGRDPGKGFPADLLRPARRKLLMLAEARQISDLAAVPGNRLEALRGDRLGHHSIRVNDQFRIVFHWTGADATDVEIVDYH